MTHTYGGTKRRRRRMVRVLTAAVSVLVFGLLCFAGFVIWASSGTGSETAWVMRMAADPAPEGDTLTIVTYNVGYMFTTVMPAARLVRRGADR